jgi:hypothetical protein
MLRKFYCVPLDYLPFKEIPSLENATIKVGYLSFLSLFEKMSMDVKLATIYDEFSENCTIEMLRSSAFLYGQMLAYGDVGITKSRLKLVGS